MVLIASWTFQRLIIVLVVVTFDGLCVHGRTANEEQNLLLNRHVMTNAAPFALESNAIGVVWSRRRGVKGRATLRIGVVVIVLHHNND